MIEGIQRLIVELIATHPAGHRLCLIGGFRYRLLSRSCRMSADIDYHWDGDLERKQAEIMDLLTKRLLPEVHTRLSYEGDVGKATGPDADSPFVKTILVALYRTGDRPDRIEIPVEVTSIACADAPVVRTVAGTVYLTASDTDMVESKVLALFSRTFVEARDIVDLFLFRDQFSTASPHRLQEKFAGLGIAPQAVTERFSELVLNRAAHARAIDAIVVDQIDDAIAANLKTAGGGSMVFDAVISLLKDQSIGLQGGQ